MRAAVIETIGAPPRYAAFPDPVPGPTEVLVEVRAAGLHPLVRSLAGGEHYGSTRQLPMIPGVDGVGRLSDGTRVYFGLVRPPYGTMAERAVVPRVRCLPLPDTLDDVTAAALFNPGLSAWLALTARAQLAPGETVVVLGATGVAGQQAVQLARHLGAGRVIAVGRNRDTLATLAQLGADVTLSLDQPDAAFIAALRDAIGEAGASVIIDYLWGRPTELLIQAIRREGLTHVAPRARLVGVGTMAGPTITLPADVLRSSGLEICGSGAGTLSPEMIMQALPRFLTYATSGVHIATEAVPLAEVAAAWQQGTAVGSRLVLIP